MLDRIRRLWKAFVERGAYPDDPEARHRIKAYILGAAVPVAKPGRVKVEEGDETAKRL